MNLLIRKIRTPDYPLVAKLIKQFYREDPEGKPTNINKIRKTFRYLYNSRRGLILVIKKDNVIIGYSILVNYWSNEYGGNILHIDELYIDAKYRGQGIGTKTIKYVKKEYGCDAVAMILEVTPQNHQAEKLYKKMGFEKIRNKFLIQEI